jgi:hypothetical protein
VSTYAVRKRLFARIAQQRNSHVISYITGDRRQLETQISPEVIDIFVGHLDAIGPVQKISLLLHTNGGNTAAAWRLINLLHTFCDDLEVIITAKALSAGTLISLGANRIVMTKQAALGPIDPSLDNPLNPTVPNMPHVRVPVSVEAVRGYLDAARDTGITDSAQLAQLLIDLSNKVHPLVLGQIFRSRSQIRFLAKKLLSRQVADEEQSKAIIDFLCAESGSHDYTINRREARELGLQIETPSDDLYKLLRSVHQSYVSEMQLLEPYDPFGMLAGQPSVNYSLPRAMIESSKGGSHRYLSEGTITQAVVPAAPGPGVMPMMPMPVQPQTAISDNRRFEGWRKL